MTDLIVLQDCATIQLSCGLNSLIDSMDQVWITKNPWRTLRGSAKGRKAKFYARRKVAGGVSFLLHREILRVEPGVTVDHINGDSLDNRRANLRAATLKQNNANRESGGGTSRFKGVSRWGGPKLHPWRADIKTNRKQIHLGSYMTEREAASAYNEAALRIQGEFARLNDLNAD